MSWRIHFGYLSYFKSVGKLGSTDACSKATLHVGLTRFVRTKIYFKCISKFRIWRELLCLLKCEVHSVLVMRKRFWRSWRSVAVVSWTSSSSVCVCFNAKVDFGDSRVWSLCFLCFILFHFAASTFSRVCIRLFISTIIFLF